MSDINYRILSQAGIPKLRRIAKTRLKFKGKGHEVRRFQVVRTQYHPWLTKPQYKDLTRLLNFYQLWLDDLYPRAKFADALVIIEKLGHTKRMQTMRREWIDEGKPKSSFDKDPEQSRGIPTNTDKAQGPLSNAVRAKEGAGSTISADVDESQPQRPHTPPGPSVEADDDLYTATPGAVRVTMALSKETNPNSDSLFMAEDAGGPQSEEDELDMLLAEDGANRERHQSDIEGDSASRAPAIPAADDFQDEMEVMAGMDDMW